MADFFDDLRRKPKKERRKIALIISSLFTLMVLAGWFGVTWKNFRSETKIIDREDSRSESPLASLRRSLDKVMESGYSQYLNVKKEFDTQASLFTEVANFENGEYNDIKLGQEEGFEYQFSTSSEESSAENSTSTIIENVSE